MILDNLLSNARILVRYQFDLAPVRKIACAHHACLEIKLIIDFLYNLDLT